MVNLITNVGEEYLYENNADGETVKVGLYEDATDALGETDNLSAVTTEPAGSAYSRQSDTVTTRLSAGEYGFDNDNQISFDVSDSNASVDAAFVVVNFQSDSVAGDGSASDNLIAAGDLSQTRDLSSVDTLNIPAGDLNIEGA
jgi:hypothetical protein